jgi:hypothetical protein
MRKLAWRGMVLRRCKQRSGGVCTCYYPVLVEIRAMTGGRWRGSGRLLELYGWLVPPVKFRFRWRTRFRRGAVWLPGRCLWRERGAKGNGFHEVSDAARELTHLKSRGGSAMQRQADPVCNRLVKTRVGEYFSRVKGGGELRGLVGIEIVLEK